MNIQEFTEKYTSRKKRYDNAYNELSDLTKKYVGTSHLLVNDLFTDLLDDLKNLNGETVKRTLLIDFLGFVEDNTELEVDWYPTVVDAYINQLNE